MNTKAAQVEFGSPRKPASRRAAFAAVLSSTAGVGLIFGIQPPLIAFSLSRGGSSSFVIGLITAASLVAVIVLGPLYPRVIARLGLRNSVAAGITGAAILLAVMPAWPAVGFWAVVRVLSGSVMGLSWIASEVWLNAISDARGRGTVMGIYGTVFSAGVMAGPLLLEWTGTRGWQPFLTGAGCLLVTVLPLAFLRGGPGESQVFTPMRPLAGTLRRAPVVMLAAAIAGLIESAELTLLPLFGVHGGLGDRAALLLVTVFMAGNVALQMPIGLLADRAGRRLMLGLCALLSGVGPLLLNACWGEPFLLWPLIFVWGGTLYAFYSQGVAMLGEEFVAAELPTANTVFVMVYCLGGVLGPSLGGLIMDAWPVHGLQSLLSGAAFLLFAAVALDARLQRRALPDC